MCTYVRMHARTHARVMQYLFSEEAGISVYPLGDKSTHKVLSRLHVHTNPAHVNKVIQLGY